MIALYIVIAILSPILLLILFAPTSFRFGRSTVIDRPQKEVFNYIRLLKNQQEWSVWASMDPNIKNTYTGVDGTVGFINSWEGNKKVGIGAQEIMRIEEGRAVEFQLRFEKPFKATNGSELLLEEISPTQTKVTWSFFGKSPRPMNAFTMFMKGAILKDFEKGLYNLKQILETN